jgi:hypothetical protein
MLTERTIHVVVVGAGHGMGVEATANSEKTVHYTGASVSVKP